MSAVLDSPALHPYEVRLGFPGKYAQPATVQVSARNTSHAIELAREEAREAGWPSPCSMLVYAEDDA